MIELYINNTRIDIDSEIEIPVTFSQVDAKFPEKRRRSFSKDLNLPGTKLNNNFFSSGYNLYISDVYGDSIGFNFDPTISYPARVEVNGQVSFSGKAYLSKVVQKSGFNRFFVNIYSDIITLFSLWSEIKVSELDWSDYDHELNITNIVNSWSATTGSGYYWPYIHYGYTNNPLSIKTNQLRPFVYVKEIAEKAFELAGMKLDGGFFNIEPLKSLVWGSGGGETITISSTDVAERLISYTGVGSDSFNSVGSGVIRIGTGLDPTYWLTFNSVREYLFKDSDFITVTLVSDDLNQFDESLGFATVANTGSYNQIVSANITLEWGCTEVTVEPQIYIFQVAIFAVVDGSIIGSYVYDIHSSAPDSETFTISLNSPLDMIIGGDVGFYFHINNSNSKFKNGGGGQMTIDLTFNAISYIVTATNSTVVDGDIINLSRFLPNMKLSDFMNDIITMFNLYVSDPDYNGEVVMLPESGYFSETDDVDDWTNKLDRSSEIEIMPAGTIDGKNYLFKWAEDRDYYKKLYYDLYGSDYGDHVYRVPSTFKKDDKIYQLKSAQSCPVKIEFSDITIPHILQRDESTGVVKPHKGKPRFFFNCGTAATSTGWRLQNSNNLTFTNLNIYPIANHLDDLAAADFDLNFGTPSASFFPTPSYPNNNMFTKYHGPFIRQLTGRDSKILRGWFKLDERDFYNNFMRKLCIIDGVVFRKNLVTDWIAGSEKLVRVELLKILSGRSRTVTDQPSVPDLPNVPDFPFTSTGSGNPEVGNVIVRSYQTFYQFDTSTGNLSADLTDEVPDGVVFTFKKVATGNKLTINAPQSKLIDGAASIDLNNNNETIRLLKLPDGNYKVV